MILIDLNVVLDVVQKREPHYGASAAVMGRVTDGGVAACLPAHAFTTLHSLVSRHQTERTADRVVDWLLRYFEVAGTTHRELRRARALSWPDFEDAVVAAAAESHSCTHIVTRNVRDFRDSPVLALAPEEFLSDSR
ncbi:type II toxin-antitoxin system VapC family toxin [Salinisphaera hydrothermalis]|uniref:Twitching motility protein PilT n=1 Tax=Salinisphaera hydrothermalis (strain C41B8) TaxID=1304275 RepID=A0A084IHE8_SALHC|nr:PIN domain-containing protein [Salinisphaera hydrothermalis]KEZ76132.1 twitching motility protein PilT [Salinisphaera hydrothermalis C41B8]